MWNGSARARGQHAESDGQEGASSVPKRKGEGTGPPEVLGKAGSSEGTPRKAEEMRVAKVDQRVGSGIGGGRGDSSHPEVHRRG